MTKKLLIVDDHAMMARSVQVVAETLGFECRTITEPDDANAAFIAFRPDILLLDMMMPEKDGLEVLEEILRGETKVQIILCSGYGDGFLRLGERMVRDYQREQVRFLKKPFRRDQLVQLLTGM